MKNAEPVLSSPMRGLRSKPRNDDGIFLAMRQNHTIRYVRLILKPQHARQQINDGVLCDVFDRAREIAGSPDRDRFSMLGLIRPYTHYSERVPTAKVAGSSGERGNSVCERPRPRAKPQPPVVGSPAVCQGSNVLSPGQGQTHSPGDPRNSTSCFHDRPGP